MDSKPFVTPSVSAPRDLFYYLDTFWDEVSDPEIIGKFGMRGGPWKFLIIIFSAIYFIRVLGPKFMEKRKPYDLQAFMFCLNGYVFGSYAMCLIGGLWLSNAGLDSFRCNAFDPREKGIWPYVGKNLGYMFIWAKLFDFVRPIICVFRKRADEITNLYLAHLSCAVFFVFLGLKLYPGGVFMFLPYLDAFYQIFAYCYLVKAASSEEMKPSFAYRRFLFAFRMTSGVALALHGLYFAFQPNCGPVFLKWLQVIYGTIGVLCGPYDWKNTNAIKAKRKPHWFQE